MTAGAWGAGAWLCAHGCRQHGAVRCGAALAVAAGPPLAPPPSPCHRGPLTDGPALPPQKNTPPQITNVKLSLNDGPFTYEPSYNLVRKAPSLAVSRPLGRGKYKVGWNLKTDDVTIEYTIEGVRFLAHKRPQELTPLIGVSFERDFGF